MEGMSGSSPYFVAWFTLAMINAGLAQRKERRGPHWWLVSILLGPIATLLMVATEPRRR